MTVMYPQVYHDKKERSEVMREFDNIVVFYDEDSD